MPASRFGPREAADEVLRQVEAGADLVDIGGQSTRPGSEPVPAEEELRRVVPVFEALRGRVRIPLSIDTDKARVARECLAAGAAVLNDVSALRNDPEMAEAALGAQAVILMHRGGALAQDHAGRPTVRRCGRQRSRLSWPSAAKPSVWRAATRRGSCSTRASASERLWGTTSLF